MLDSMQVYLLSALSAARERVKRQTLSINHVHRLLFSSSLCLSEHQQNGNLRDCEYKQKTVIIKWDSYLQTFGAAIFK